MLGFQAVSVLPVSAFLSECVRVDFAVSAKLSANPSFVVFFASENVITQAADSPGNTPIDGTLIRALNFQRSILGGSYGIGRLQSGFGEIEIVTTGGQYDDLLDRYRPDGRKVTLKVMEAGGAYRTAIPAFNGVAVRWANSLDRGKITVRDNSYKLDVPARRSVYAGTGSLEGGTELAGKRRPLALGTVKNIPGVLVMPNANLYDVNDGPVQAITAARDKGAALAFTSNYATTALLLAASLSTGQFATCLADGRARIGGNPTTQIRFDVSGDKTGGVFASTTADVIKRLIAEITKALDPSDLAADTFAAVNAAQPAPIGYYVHSESGETVAEIAGKLMEGIGGWAGCQLRGKFEIGIIRAPDASQSPDERYSEIDGELIEIDRYPMPDAVSPPPTNVRVAWDRNWLKQDDIPASVVTAQPALAAWLGTDTRYAVPLSVVPLQSGQVPKEQTREAYFVFEVDAIAEATRSYLLFRQNFNLYQYRVKGPLFLNRIGAQNLITTRKRLGLSNGRPLRTLSINDDTDSRVVEIIGFG